jgi:hypothetical protein
MKIGLFCREFPSSTRLSTGVEDDRAVACEDNADPSGAAISLTTSQSSTVENLALKRSVYTRRSPQAERSDST